MARHSTASTRRLRRELACELSKLRGLEHAVEGMPKGRRAKAFAKRICEQAEICLDLLDRYESSVPGPAWSYAARKCQPLREELKRTDWTFRLASGDLARRAGENPQSAPAYEPPPTVPRRRASSSEPRPANQSRGMFDAAYHSPNHPYPSDVDLWLEDDEPIMLRAVSGSGAVELNPGQARDLGRALIELADLSVEMREAPFGPSAPVAPLSPDGAPR